MKKILFFIIFFIFIQGTFADLSIDKIQMLDKVFMKVETILKGKDVKTQMNIIEKATTKLYDDIDMYNYYDEDDNKKIELFRKNEMQAYLYDLFKEKYIKLVGQLKGKDLEEFLYNYYSFGVKNYMNYYYTNEGAVNILDEILKSGNLTKETIVNSINLIRKDYGLQPLKYNDKVAYATLMHSKYLLLNNEEKGLSSHDEIEGKKGFYGKKAGDRMQKAGFTSFGYFEVISWDYNRLKSVKSLLSIPYHRIPFISPKYDTVGFPFNTEDNQYGVINFGKSSDFNSELNNNVDDIIVFPKDDGILYDYIGSNIREVPFPFPGNEDIIGKVVSIGVINSDYKVDKNSILLTDLTNKERLEIILAEDKTEGWHHFIAKQPLKRNTKYEIAFSVKIISSSRDMIYKSVFYTGDIK